MTYPSTPELDKLRETMELQEFTQRLGEVLDSTEGFEGFVLAEWVPDSCRSCGGTGKIYRMRQDDYRKCHRCKGGGDDDEYRILAHRSPSNKNLTALFGLDYDKMEAEREAVLEYIRAGP